MLHIVAEKTLMYLVVLQIVEQRASPELSKYELKRREMIMKRQQFLESLGVMQVKDDLKQLVAPSCRGRRKTVQNKIKTPP